MIGFNICLTNTKTNTFWLTKKVKYKYKSIKVDKKGKIQILIQIFRLIFANTNTNMNIYHTLFSTSETSPGSEEGIKGERIIFIFLTLQCCKRGRGNGQHELSAFNAFNANSYMLNLSPIGTLQ